MIQANSQLFFCFKRNVKYILMQCPDKAKKCKDNVKERRGYMCMK